MAPRSGQLPSPKHPVDCLWCNEPLRGQVARAPCFHMFHVHCLKRDRESSIRDFPSWAVHFPMCRADLQQRPYDRTEDDPRCLLVTADNGYKIWSKYSSDIRTGGLANKSGKKKAKAQQRKHRNFRRHLREKAMRDRRSETSTPDAPGLYNEPPIHSTRPAPSTPNRHCAPNRSSTPNSPSTPHRSSSLRRPSTPRRTTRYYNIEFSQGLDSFWLGFILKSAIKSGK